MLSAISSTSPLVFIMSPGALQKRQLRCLSSSLLVRQAGVNLPTDANTMRNSTTPQ
jgi:hypothetical protein